MLSYQQVGFRLCINDFLFFSLLTYLGEFFFYSVWSYESVCVTILPLHWTFVLPLSLSLVMSNYCSDTHVGYFVLFCNVLHSGTHRPHTEIYIYIYWTSRRCLYQKVWIGIYTTPHIQFLLRSIVFSL